MRLRLPQIAVLVIAALVAAAAFYVVANPPGAGGGSGSRESAYYAEPPIGAEAAPATDPTGAPAPQVKTRIDVQLADRVPAGFQTFDSGESASPTVVRGGLMQHGTPEGGSAAGYLETRLPGGGDVERIGAEVTFPADGESGAVALIGWEGSLVSARTERNTLPRSGMHFVAYPGSWHLGIIDPEGEVLEDIVGRGDYVNVNGPQTFDLVRRGNTVWVTDPGGGVTEVADERVAAFTGSWACWELFEPDADRVPATISRVWAG